MSNCFIGVFVKLFTMKKKNPPIPLLSPSHQVRKTSEHSSLPATFAHCPHSSPETQYLTIDKQLTHLFFWGTRWLAPSPTLAALTAREPAKRDTQTDNLVMKPQIAIKLLYFTIRNTDFWLTMIRTQCIFFSYNSNFWLCPVGSSLCVNKPINHLDRNTKTQPKLKERQYFLQK